MVICDYSARFELIQRRPVVVVASLTQANPIQTVSTLYVMQMFRQYRQLNREDGTTNMYNGTWKRNMEHGNQNQPP